MSTTSLSAYTKVLLKAKLLRGVYLFDDFKRRVSGNGNPSPLQPFETITIPSTKPTSKGNRNITIKIYKTKAALDSNVGPVAVHLNWHGSGFVLPMYGTDIGFIEHLLNHPLLASYPLAILDCDYAKAPEYPCPAAPDDARDAIDYVFRNPRLYDLNKVTLGGFSAGANLAMGLSVDLGNQAHKGVSPYGDGKSHPIPAVIAFYPVAKWVSERVDVPVPPGPQTWPGIPLPKEVTDIFDDSYWFSPVLNDPPTAEEDRARVKAWMQMPLYSPACADSKEFPRYIELVTCEYDHLSIEGEKLREALSKDMTKQVYGRRIDGVGHSWDLVTAPGQTGYKERCEMYDIAARIIARVGGVEVEI
ncbi:hypothetical protein FRC19_001316 [Serendipita sp. 401]|nr:hypothetical protein FRC19_001316 [Serendipita sp. 401]KAG9049187.1 hypothetical protein FS842_000235 [Serendipita sp. 407]